MAIVKMKRLSVVGFRTDEAAVMDALQRMGGVQVEDALRSQGEQPAASLRLPLQEEIASVDACIALVKDTLLSLERVSPAKQGMLYVRPDVSVRRLARDAADEELLCACRRVRACEDEHASLRARDTRSAAQRARLAPWTDLAAPLNELADTRSTRCLPGLIPASAMAAAAPLLDANDLCALHEVSRGRDGVYALALAHREQADAFFEGLRALGFARVSFAGTGPDGGPEAPAMTAAQLLAAYDELAAQTLRERAALEERIAQEVALRGDLRVLSDKLVSQRERLEAGLRLAATRDTFYLTGWCLAAQAAGVEGKLRALCEELYVEFADPAADEDVPTAMVNNGFVTPFESVTTMYTPPTSSEVDPNGLMAPFFAMFYGMMVSDAGYGVVLALGAFLYVKYCKPRGMVKSVAQVLVFGGISTLIWGSLFGGWFGLSVTKATPFLGLFYWFSPMDNPMQMLILCYGLGLLHMFTGMSIKAYRFIREGDFFGAVVDVFSWMALILGLIAMVAGGSLPALKSVGTVMMIAGTGTILLFKARGEKNLLKRILSGLGALYGISGYLSDVLSYSRLFAMGLATGIIGMVFNKLAGLLLASPVGFIFGIAVLAVGHTFNIAINALGAYVHACRLQYIEFFSRFFDGGGRLFTPLTVKGRYVTWQDEHR